jgi:hypothetical protein
VNLTASVGGEDKVAVANLRDTGTANYLGMCQYNTASNLIIVVINTAGTYASVSGVTATVPFTWGSTDEFNAFGSYEAAS